MLIMNRLINIDYSDVSFKNALEDDDEDDHFLKVREKTKEQKV